MKHYLQLIRWFNLIIIALTMIVIRYGVIYPFLEVNSFHFIFETTDFFLLITALVLISAAGYAINDYFDRRIDLSNKPDKVLVGLHIDNKKVLTLYNILTVTGLGIGIYLSYKINHLNFALVFAFITGALWFYSTSYKRQLIVGNVIIALLTATVPLLVLLFDIPLVIEHYRLVLMSNAHYTKEISYINYAVLIFSLFAFLMTYVRELVKDMEDIKGDKEGYSKTMPIVWGIRFSKYVAILVTSVIIMALSFIYYLFLLNDMIALVYLIVLLVLPLLGIIYFILKAKDKKDYGRISRYLKWIMLLGLAYTIPFYFHIMH